ncbi:hypothetical protein WMY93_002873 [Mugilogobius chulae]|uniref:peptidylprolyl isomerase n=1 Tax=Mugilogobius chulae TaxID=88201 RepID=A0AAW0Q4V5_9GOBI
MGVKAQRPRCFMDIAIGNVFVGRVVVELFSDICPKTCENFRCLCTGERGVGKGTQKPLHYKGCLFHRIVKDFMIQGGDFSEGNGRGGESIYGGFFEDESFAVKHNKEYLLSMANRGKDTNGSQFFITTKPTPHLDGVHVVFGHVISGQEVVQTMENQKTDPNSKPYADVKVLNCGELVPKSKAKKEKKKKKTKKQKKHKKKQKKTKPEAVSADEKEEQEEVVSSTVRPEEIPPIPENRFLMRRSPQQAEKDEPKKEQRKGERTSFGISYNSAFNRRLVMTRSGRKIKGRGPRRYRTPSRSRSRSRERFRRSETPPHWRQEMQRQRMRAVTGERWIKGDRGEVSDGKEEVSKRERRSSNSKHEDAAESKKDKKTRNHRSKSKEDNSVAKDGKHGKHKTHKKRGESRSKSREKKRSKSREKEHKSHKSDEKRGRSRSKENHGKDKSKHDESSKKHKDDFKGRNGEGTRSKSCSRDKKDSHRDKSRDKDNRRDKDRDRGRNRSRSRDRRRDSENKTKRESPGSRDHRRRSSDRSKARDAHRSRHSRSRSKSKDRSARRQDKEQESGKHKRRHSSSDSDRDKEKVETAMIENPKTKGAQKGKDQTVLKAEITVEDIDIVLAQVLTVTEMAP